MQTTLKSNGISTLLISFLLVGLLAVAMPQVAGATAVTGYQVTNTTLLGGEGTWDYLTFDSAARQLYIARRGPGVTVFNVDTKQVIGVVDNTKGVNGVALVPEVKRGFATVGGNVVMFDTTTLAFISSIPAHDDLDAIVYDPASKLVFAFSGEGPVTAIDPASGTAVGTIELPSKKVEFPAVDGKGHLYVNLQDTRQVAVIDTKQLKMETFWVLNQGSLNTPMAIDAEKGRLFIGCRNGYLTIFDTNTGKILQELPILGYNCDSIVYDSVTKLIFVANTNATMTIYQETSKGDFAVVDFVLTQAWAKTMALDLKTHSVYLAGAKTGAFVPKKTWPELIPDTFSVLTVSRK